MKKLLHIADSAVYYILVAVAVWMIFNMITTGAALAAFIPLFVLAIAQLWRIRYLLSVRSK